MIALRKAIGLSQTDLGRKIGVGQSTISRIEDGDTRDPRHLYQLAEALFTTVDYLYGKTDDAGVIEFRGTGRDLEDLAQVVTDQRSDYRSKDSADLATVMLPQLEVGYSMGGGSVFEEYQATAMVPFPREWLRPLIGGTFADLFVARGEGDSMVPTLLDGDLVIVDTAQKQIRQQDRLWCLSFGDLGMIKRARVLPGGTVQINSDNPAVTPIEAADEEMHVIGRVIWIGRRV